MSVPSSSVVQGSSQEWSELSMDEKLNWIGSRIARMEEKIESLDTDVDNLKNDLARDMNSFESRLNGQFTNVHTQMTNNRNHFDQALQGASQAITAIAAQITGLGQPAQQGVQQPQQQASGQGITTTPRTLKINKPEKFDGTDLEKTSEFVVASQLYLRDGAAGATAEQKITFVISLMTGPAQMWVQPFLEQDLMARTNVANQVPWLHDEALFWTEFNSRYADINRTELYREKLLKLRQGTSTVQDYLTKFYAYSAPLGYGDTELRDQFYYGLHDEVKKSFSYQNVDHTTLNLTQLTTRALTVDKHLISINAYKASKPAVAPSQKTTTNNSATTSQATGRERFNVNDRVYMRGADGKVVKGQITSIGRNAKGQTVPNVQWSGNSGTTQIPFRDLNKDTRPPLDHRRTPTPAAPPRDSRGPAPMDLDSAGKGKIVFLCNNCGRKGHMARNCPTPKALSGFEATAGPVIEETNSEEESLKGDA